MARDGTGIYYLPDGNPVVTGTIIESTWANETMDDIASALSTSIAANGETTVTANLPMSTYRHTNVGNALARTQYASAAQVQDGSITWLTSISGTDTISATAPLTMTAYAAGQVFRFIAANTNTGAVTLDLNAIGAKDITKLGTVDLLAGEIIAGGVYEVVYDGTQFQIGSVHQVTGGSVVKEFAYTATGGETTITLDFSYVPGTNSLLVFENGLRIYPSDHYTESDSNEITLTEAADAGDKYVITAKIYDIEDVLQPSTEASIVAIAALTPAANKFPYYTSATAASLADITAMARTLLAISTAADFRTALSVYSTTEVDALIPAAIGVGQTWQDVKASRAIGTSYHNTTGKPIQVQIKSTNSADDGAFQVSTDGSTWLTLTVDGTSGGQYWSVIIPDAYYYKVINVDSIGHWAELR